MKARSVLRPNRLSSPLASRKERIALKVVTNNTFAPMVPHKGVGDSGFNAGCPASPLLLPPWTPKSPSPIADNENDYISPIKDTELDILVSLFTRLTVSDPHSSSTSSAPPVVAHPITKWESDWHLWETWKSRWADVGDPESVVGCLMHAHREQWIDAGNAEPHLLDLDTWRSRQDDPDPQSMVGQWMEKLKYKRATPASAVLAAPVLERPITEWESRWFSWGTWKSQWADVDNEESVVGSMMRAHCEQWYDAGKTERHLLDLESWRSQWADPDDPDSLVYNLEIILNPPSSQPSRRPLFTDVEASPEGHFATPLDDEALFLPLRYPPILTLKDLGLDRFLPAADISFEGVSNTSTASPFPFEYTFEVPEQPIFPDHPPSSIRALLTAQETAHERNVRRRGEYIARSAAPWRPGFFGLNFTTPPKEKARMDAEIEAELKTEAREERKARREKRARRKEEEWHKGLEKWRCGVEIEVDMGLKPMFKDFVKSVPPETKPPETSILKSVWRASVVVGVVG
ncbi:hypothetical protein DXG03_008780, partial [Asterophora parasitica]